MEFAGTDLWFEWPDMIAILDEAGYCLRLPAGDLESFVVTAVAERLRDPEITSNWMERAADGNRASLAVVISSHLLRCGKQAKLILGDQSDEPHRINEKLVGMITKPQRWYEGSTSGKYPTSRAICNEENLDKSYVRRLLSASSSHKASGY